LVSSGFKISKIGEPRFSELVESDFEHPKIDRVRKVIRYLFKVEFILIKSKNKKIYPQGEDRFLLKKCRIVIGKPGFE
jgi:hypothetical protein